MASSSEVGSDCPFVEGFTAGSLRFSFADLRKCARRAQYVEGFLKGCQVIRRDQHDGRAAVLGDCHAGVGGLDVGDEFGQPVSRVSERYLGHSQKYGQFRDTDAVQLSGWLSPEQFWAHMDALEQRVRSTATVLPCYGLAEWSGRRMVGDWQWQDDRLVAVGLAHGDPAGDGPSLHVLTVVDDPRRKVISLQLAERGARFDEEDAVRRYREAESAPASQIHIPVDAGRIRFDIWRDRDLWWAAADHADFGLVVEARRIPPEGVALVRVHDIELYLIGRRQYLKELRGET
jgi:hypothetical protein